MGQIQDRDLTELGFPVTVRQAQALTPVAPVLTAQVPVVQALAGQV